MTKYQITNLETCYPKGAELGGNNFVCIEYDPSTVYRFAVLVSYNGKKSRCVHLTLRDAITDADLKINTMAQQFLVKALTQ